MNDVDYLARIYAGSENVRLQADSVMSSLTGMGVIGRDKAASATFAGIRWLSAEEEENHSITEGVIHRLINAPPQDALSSGFSVDTDDDKGVLARALKESGLNKDKLEVKLIELLSSARQHGGAHLLVITRGVKDWSKPLGKGPHQIAALHVVGAPESRPTKWDKDPESEYYLLPSHWSLTLNRSGVSANYEDIHRSHLIHVTGLPKTAGMAVYGKMGHGISVPQAYSGVALDMGLAARSMAIASMEQSILHMNISGNAIPARMGDNRSTSKADVELFNKTRSNLGLSVTAGETTLERLDANLTGMPVILQALNERVSAVEGFPIAYIMGQSTTGFSGEDLNARSDRNNALARQRKYKANPVILDITERLLGDGEKFEVVWPDFDVPTAVEQSQISLNYATRVQALIGSTAITPAESSARCHGSVETNEPVGIELAMPGPELPLL